MKKKILFAVKNMNIGGVEKSLLSLLNTMDQEQYEVDLLLLEDYGGYMKEIPQWVNVIVWEDFAELKTALDGSPVDAVLKYIKRGRIGRAADLLLGWQQYKKTGDFSFYYKSVFRKVEKLKGRYDVAVAYSSINGYLTWLLNHYVDAERRVGWIHFEINKMYIDKRFMLTLHKPMDKIYIVSPSSYEMFVSQFPELEAKCEVRYNVVDEAAVKYLANEKVENIRADDALTIVTLGRLTNQKRQDIIPEVVAKLQQQGEKVKWYLIGEGGIRGKIEENCKKYGVEDSVILLGLKSNPYPYLKQADLYVQTSAYEGYCIALAEARVFGLPCVATEFSGAHEQLDGRENSYVVNLDTEEIADAILKVAASLKGAQNGNNT